MRVQLVVLPLLVVLAGCPEPARKPLPTSRPHSSGEERRTHPFKAPALVGTVEGTRYYLDLEGGTRPVLVETDAKNRTLGHAYLASKPDKAFADTDVVILASADTVYCYDTLRHELRWQANYSDRGYEHDFDVDAVVRRGGKLDVIFAGKTSETLDIQTGQKTVP